MKHAASKMKLKPRFEEQYRRRHDAIWSELSQLLHESGVVEYSIFLDEDTLALFAFQKLRERNKVEDLSSHPLVRKWWDSMADTMKTNPDNSPVSVPLNEVFRL